MKALLTMLLVAVAWQARAECVLIRGAKVQLPGKAEVTDVVIEDGKITLAARAGCTIVVGEGMVLTAGFVDAWTALGVEGIELEDSTVDTKQTTPYQDDDHVVRAAVRGSLAYDPRSIPVGVALSGGVTSALVAPDGGIISGRAFFVQLAGTARADVLVKDPVGMVARWSVRPSRAAAASIIEVALREAIGWPKVRAAWERGQHHDPTTAPLDLDALQPVVRGEIPLIVAIDRAADIEALLAMTADTPVRLVLVGGAEAWRLAPELAKRQVAVVVDPLSNAPYGFDQLGARADNAALLEQAGVKVMMSVFNTHQVRKLRQVAGNAVRAGMTWDGALKALTETPAEVLGLKDRGRIANGAVADLVLWSGDPFELSTRVVQVWVRGREAVLRTRQTDLFERYRHL